MVFLYSFTFTGIPFNFNIIKGIMSIIIGDNNAMTGEVILYIER